MAGSGKARRLRRPAAFSRYKDRPSLAVFPFSSIFSFYPLPPPSLFHGSAPPLLRPSPIALPRPCTRRFAKTASYRSSALHPSNFSSSSVELTGSDLRLGRAQQSRPLIRSPLPPPTATAAQLSSNGDGSISGRAESLHVLDSAALDPAASALFAGHGFITAQLTCDSTTTLAESFSLRRGSYSDTSVGPGCLPHD